MTSELAKATAKSTPEDKRTIAQWFDVYHDEIETQLGKALDPGAFIRAAISSVRQSPALQNASYTSVLGSVMLAAQLHLEIGPALGHFYLTPRTVQGVQECVPVIGYKGYCELAYRTGRIEKIEAFIVREDDDFTMGANSERGRFFDWTPAKVDGTSEPVGVVAVAKVIGAGTSWAHLTRDQIESRRPSHWVKTPWGSPKTVDQMWLKTGVRDLAKFLPMSTHLGQALRADERRVERLEGISDELVIDEGDATAEDEPITLEEPQ